MGCTPKKMFYVDPPLDIICEFLPHITQVRALKYNALVVFNRRWQHMKHRRPYLAIYSVLHF